MLVPQRACGRIIGRNGENIRSIARASSAKITVESSSASKDACAERRVIIKGTAEQIELAKSLIKEKVEEDDEIRKKLEESLSNRSPRKKDRHNFLMAAGDAQTSEPERHPSERLSATGSDGLMEVYVSAVHSPEKFWLQVIGPRAVELDHLVEQMTDYYSKDENKEIHAIRELRLGHVVAAPFSFDEKWYRAEVTDITEDEYDPQESKISLYYVDYGDSDDLKKKDIYELRTDFLRLRFQAIECCLAKVLPKGGKWSDEAIDLFEQLTHCAQWVVVMARIDSYKERERNHGKREGSPVPCVELYDPQRSKDISVAEELVKQDFAEWEKSENPAVPNGEPSAASTSKSGDGSVQGQRLRKLDGDNVKVEAESPKILKSENMSLSLEAGGDIANHQVSGHLPKDESPTAQEKGRKVLIFGPDESDEESSDEMEMC
ncbi:tudor and KH domain-containing protein homolog isoform X2 [Anabrus simplex]